MIVNTKIYNEQFCVCHFSFNKKETIDILNNDYYKNISKRIDKKLHEIGIVPIGTKDIIILTTNFKKDNIIGVAKFAILSEINNIAFPVNIPKKLLNDELICDCDFGFELILLLNNLVYEDDADRVTNNSVVYYDLTYNINGKDETIYDIRTDAKTSKFETDDFLEYRQFDKIDLVDNDGIKYVATIKRIIDIVPFSEDRFDIDKIQKLGFKDFMDLEFRFRYSYTFFTRVDYIIDYILNFASKGINFNPCKELKKHYLRNPFIPYYEQYSLSSSKKQKTTLCNIYLLEMVSTMLEINTEDIFNKFDDEYILKITSMKKDMYLTKDINYLDIEYTIMKIKILEYFISENIIKNFSVDL